MLWDQRPWRHAAASKRGPLGRGRRTLIMGGLVVGCGLMRCGHPLRPLLLPHCLGCSDSENDVAALGRFGETLFHVNESCIHCLQPAPNLPPTTSLGHVASKMCFKDTCGSQSQRSATMETTRACNRWGREKQKSTVAEGFLRQQLQPTSGSSGNISGNI